MAKRKDPRLGAALGGLLGTGTAPAGPSTGRIPVPPPAGGATPPAPLASADAPASTSTGTPGAGTYTRTGRGYTRADGAKRERLSLYFTPAQLRRLKADAAAAGLSPAAYVAARLGLPDDEA